MTHKHGPRGLFRCDECDSVLAGGRCLVCEAPQNVDPNEVPLAHIDHYAPEAAPRSVMTLDAAIMTHPALWAEMGRLYEVDDDSDVLFGMVKALSIVGGFAPIDVHARLIEDFG